MRWLTWALPILLIAPTAQSANSPLPDAAGNPDRGMGIFSAYCAACHGDSGQGDGPMAPRLMRDFNVQPTNFTLPSWQQGRSDEELVRTIRGGGRAVHRTAFMPAWGVTLTDQQTRDLRAYLRELGKPGATNYAPAATLGIQQTLELGRTLYTLHCLACHGPRGEGNGPRMQQARDEGLTTLEAGNFASPQLMNRLTDDQIHEYAQSGLYHSKISFPPEQNPWWHRPLNSGELQALTLYVRSLSLH